MKELIHEAIEFLNNIRTGTDLEVDAWDLADRLKDAVQQVSQEPAKIDLSRFVGLPNTADTRRAIQAELEKQAASISPQPTEQLLISIVKTLELHGAYTVRQAYNQLTTEQKQVWDVIAKMHYE
jgi:hypothetical protein